MNNIKSKKEIWFVVNAASGNNQERKLKIISAIEKRIANGRIDGKIIKTEYAGHARHIAKDAVENNIYAIVGIGGDGTLNEIAPNIKNTEISLGIIPAGSGNGLARHLHIPFKIEKALNVIEAGNIQQNDLIKANDHTIVSISGIGFDAEIAKLFQETRIRGLRGYLYFIFKQYFRYKTEKYKITIDDEESFEQNAFLVCCANANQFGYEFRIAPTAKTNDGLLDLVIVSHASIIEFFEKLGKPFKIKSFNDYLFLYRKVKKVTIERENDGIVNIDGEAIKMDKKVTFSILENAIKIIVPKRKK